MARIYHAADNAEGTAVSPDTQSAEHKSFKCEQCGARMVFQPGSSSQACPYCSHENPIPQSEADIREMDYQAHLLRVLDEEECQERLTIQCKACGGESTTDPNVTAQQCPFCGSDIVATAKSVRVLKPQSLLPFHVKKDEARKLYRQWLQKLWFAPNDLKKRARSDNPMEGMYVPYWTYDCDTKSYYRGQRGDNYTTTESYTTTENGKTVRKTRTVTKIRWRSVSGTVWNQFDDITVLASDSLPRKYTERLEPWDLHNLAPYQDEYLSGFKAESYHVNLAEGFEYAKGKMEGEIRRDIRRDIGGDHQRISSVSTQYDDITFKHILLPVWINAYRYKGNSFRFLVNGRTGEVQGERPWSWVKILLAVLGSMAFAALVALIIMYFNSH
ncbi:MAG: hypothetical protein ACLFQ6_11590 [Candidatus Sumerlaeia bacterium]